MCPFHEIQWKYPNVILFIHIQFISMKFQTMLPKTTNWHTMLTVYKFMGFFNHFRKCQQTMWIWRYLVVKSCTQPDVVQLQSLYESVYVCGKIILWKYLYYSFIKKYLNLLIYVNWLFKFNLFENHFIFQELFR